MRLHFIYQYQQSNINQKLLKCVLKEGGERKERAARETILLPDDTLL